MMKQLNALLRHGRLEELAVTVALGVFGVLLPVTQQRNVPPESSPELGFPVRVGDVWCDAAALQAEAGPCAEAKAAGAHAWMQVSNAVVLTLAIAIPAVWLLAQWGRALHDGRSTFSAVYPYGGKLCAWRDGSVGLVLALAISALLTNFIKRAAGRPRPNYYALMALDAAEYGGNAVRSFPSGHASSAMSGLHFLSLWLRATSVTGLPRALQSGWKHLVLSFAFFAPTCLAIWVGITRVEDHWHGYADVLAGCIIGFTAAERGFMHCAAHSASAGHRYGVLDAGDEKRLVDVSSHRSDGVTRNAAVTVVEMSTA